jgi:hypothetical protein
MQQIFTTIVWEKKDFKKKCNNVVMNCNIVHQRDLLAIVMVKKLTYSYWNKKKDFE